MSTWSDSPRIPSAVPLSIDTIADADDAQISAATTVPDGPDEPEPGAAAAPPTAVVNQDIAVDVDPLLAGLDTDLGVLGDGVGAEAPAVEVDGAADPTEVIDLTEDLDFIDQTVEAQRRAEPQDADDAIMNIKAPTSWYSCLPDIWADGANVDFFGDY